ncbi:MAG: hypothetical protein H6577_07805 [Lewinellaceae bacterium]|nr:hypothetical protein [Saprospiraceae bacterium]MCB9338018.1 hypothetical protein [Lewinellaceae bacterium]
MKTLALSIELSTIAVENTGQPISLSDFLARIKNTLLKRTDLLGRFRGSRLDREEDFGADLHINEYRLDFEKHSLLLQMIRLQARGTWEVKGFRFI